MWATIFVCLIAFCLLVWRAIPSDVYPTFQLFELYGYHEVAAFVFVQCCTLGILIGGIVGVLKSLRGIAFVLVASTVNALLLGTLLLGAGRLVSENRLFLALGLIAGSVLFFTAIVRLPDRLRELGSTGLIVASGALLICAGWFFGFVASLYPFAFFWALLAAVGTLVFRITDTFSVPKLVIGLVGSVILTGALVDVSRTMDKPFAQARNILLWRIPEVAVSFDFSAPMMLTGAHLKRVFSSSESSVTAHHYDFELEPLPEGPHVLFITVDAFRRDRFSQKITPYLWTLGEQGIVYTDVFSPSPTTLYSVTSFLTGLYPSDLLELETPPLTVPTYLKMLGYETASSAQLEWDGAVFPQFASVPFGFDQISSGKTDQARLKEAAERISASTTVPRFEYVHLMDTHGPFRSSDGYDQTLSKTDKMIAEIVKPLRSELGAKNLLVVVVGDHGEALGEHGMWAHSQSLFSEQVAVPFIINGADINAERRSKTGSLTTFPKILSAIIERPFPVPVREESGLSVQEFHVSGLLMWTAIRDANHSVHERLMYDDQLGFDRHADPQELKDLGTTPDVTKLRSSIEKIQSGRSSWLEAYKRTLEESR